MPRLYKGIRTVLSFLLSNHARGATRTRYAPHVLSLTVTLTKRLSKMRRLISNGGEWGIFLNSKNALLVSVITTIMFSPSIGCGTNPSKVANTTNTSTKVTSHEVGNVTDATGQIQPSIAPPKLISINMVNQSTGWAAGLNSVWHTVDGGIHWQNVTPKLNSSSNNFTINIFGLGTEKAWVGVSDVLTDSVSVYYTQDGGKSWVNQIIHDTGSPVSLHFLDENHGWISLGQGAAAGSQMETVYQTNNGGNAWNKVSTTNNVKGGTLPFGGDKIGVTFVDRRHGFATGFSPVNGHVYLFETTDDGQTWTAEHLTVPSALKEDTFLSYPPEFFGSEDGILPVIANDGTLLVYGTTNGGHTWTPTSTVAGEMPNGLDQDWTFTSAKDGFVISKRGLFSTDDGGKTWVAVTTNNPLNSVIQLDFTSQQDGWALASSGSLYRTVDGGHTWRKIS